jgi:uncharacterized membrane protein
MKFDGPITRAALFWMALIPAFLLIVGMLSAWTGRPHIPSHQAMDLSSVLTMWLCLVTAACGSQFEDVWRFMKAHISPRQALISRVKQLGWHLWGFWLLCTAPSLLMLRPSGGAIFMLFAKQAIVIVATGAILFLAQKLHRRLSRYWRGLRWPLLEGRPSQAFAQLGLLPALFGLTGSPDHGHAGLPYWGETLDWRYIVRLLLLSYMALVLLQSRDLHWRRLLAPGGTHRPSIGWRIFVSSLSGNLLIAAVLTGLCCALVAAVSAYTGNFSLLAAVQWPAFVAAMACDLALATALAVVLRGFAGSKEAALLWEVSLLTLTVGVTAAWSFWDFGPEPTFTWQRNSTHALALLAALLLLRLLMQRAWQRADLVRLLTHAREQRADQD